MVANGFHSDRAGERRWHVDVPAITLGLLMLVAGVNLHGWFAAIVLLAATPVYYAMQAPWVAIMTELFRGERAALAIATVNMLGIIGGLLGPYWMGWMRERTGGFAVGLGSLFVVWVVFASSIAWVTRRRPATASMELADVELMAATEKSL